MPTALSIPMNMERFNWFFESEPEPYMDGRRLHCPRGKCLGGSSSINGMVYVRGHACDFDEWEEQGAQGWGYRHCLPYFRRSERWKDGGDDYRGGDGPLATNNGNEMKNPLYRAFVEAGEQAGYSATDDYNGFRQEGFGAMHMTVKDGVRWSTSRAYLDPVRARPNLEVVTKALTERVVMEGRRATGVAFRRGARLTIATPLRPGPAATAAPSIAPLRALSLGQFLRARRAVHPRNLLTQHPLDGLQRLDVLRCHQHGGEAFAASAPRTANAVDVILGMYGDVVVEDVAHGGDVETTRRHVARGEKGYRSVAERFERGHALPLVQVAVKRADAEAVAQQ